MNIKYKPDKIVIGPDVVLDAICAWCGNPMDSRYTYESQEGDIICEDCENKTTKCERCGVKMHEDESINGLCDICHDDMFD